MSKINYIHTVELHNTNAANEVVPLLLRHISPRSVIDVGCGLGTWLKVFSQNGVDEYLGLDGDHVDRNLLEIGEDFFTVADLFIDNELSMLTYTDCNSRFEVSFEEQNVLQEPVFGFVIKNNLGTQIIEVNNRHIGIKLSNTPVNKGVIILELQDFPLYSEGIYSVDIFCGDREDNTDSIENAFYFYLKKRIVISQADC